MRRTWYIVLGVVLLVLVAVSAPVFWTFWGRPARPAFETTARVVAIVGSNSRFHPDRFTIVVRNARGTGEFSMNDGDIRCHVGDAVAVEQRGVVLMRIARTCR